MKGRQRRMAWRVVACVLGNSGCLGYPDPLPAPLAGSESSGADTTTTSTTTGASTTTDTAKVSTTTGPIAECGNGEVEDGEDCDGTDWNGADCESLGFSETGLVCVGCQFDVSGCGPPPGMVEVPGGVFEMGSNVYEDEMPIRQVQVDVFWMDETEVTAEAYAACADAGMCSEPARGVGCNWMVAGREDHPINCVTWFQAEEYCGWAGEGTKRLPTEAEWEKAARGTDAREYPWGDGPAPSCSHVVMNDAAAGGAGCGMGSTWAVGSKPLGNSPYDAHDMAGNAWEWVADWYASAYDGGATDNPTGPEVGSLRALRGGPWDLINTLNFRAAKRSGSNPVYHSDVVGFRCARTPPAPLLMVRG